MRTTPGRDWKLREKPLWRPPEPIENPTFTAACAWGAGCAKPRRAPSAAARRSVRFMMLLLGLGGSVARTSDSAAPPFPRSPLWTPRFGARFALPRNCQDLPRLLTYGPLSTG